MSMHRDDILDWLMDLPEDAEVGIDEGGLTLIVIEHDAHLEIGGIEKEKGDHCHKNKGPSLAEEIKARKSLGS